MNDILAALEELVSNPDVKQELIDDFRNNPNLQKKYRRNRKEKYRGDSFYYWIPFFEEKTALAKKEINDLVVDLEDKKISDFINRLLHQLKQIVSENFELTKHIGDQIMYDNDEAFPVALGLVLKDFKKLIESEYKKYLDRTNTRSFDDFESDLLHLLLDQQRIIHFARHTPMCTCIADARKESERFLDNAIRDYPNYHSGFVSKWIIDEKDAGHSRSEKDFISLILNKERFAPNNETGMIDYYRKNCRSCKRVLVFKKEFFDKYILPFNRDLNKFLTERLTDLNSLDDQSGNPQQTHQKVTLDFLDNLVNDTDTIQSFLSSYNFSENIADIDEQRRRRFYYYDRVMTRYEQVIKNWIHEEARSLDPSRLKIFVNQTFGRIVAMEQIHFSVDPPDGQNDYDDNFAVLKRVITSAIDQLKDHIRKTYKQELNINHRRDFPEFAKGFLSVGKHEVVVEQAKKNMEIMPGILPDLEEHVRIAMLDLEENYDDFYLIWKHEEKLKGRSPSEADFISQCKKILAREKDGKNTVFKMKNYRTIDDKYAFDEEFFEQRFAPMITKVEEFLDERKQLIPSPIVSPPQSEVAMNIEQKKEIEKVPTTYTVGQLGLLYKLFKKVGAINFKSDKEATDFAAEHFTTERLKRISKTQTRQKPYELTPEDYEQVNTIIMKIHNEIVPHLPKPFKQRQSSSS